MCTSFVGCSSSTSDDLAESVRPAYVAKVRAGDGERMSFIGEVRATRRAELAFPVAGRVAEVLVEAGDVVQSGQVLARLDSLPFMAQTSAAEATLAEAQHRMARLELAKQSGAVSPGETTAIEAELRSARAQRDAVAWSQRQAMLRSPVDGVVATRLIEAGQAAGPGAPVMTIDGAGRELAVLVPNTTALKAGQPVSLQSGDTQIDSRILRVGGRLEVGGVRRVYLAVPDSAAVGSTWAVVIRQAADGGTSPTLQVPLRAVLPTAAAGQGRVLRLAADGRTTELADVTLGELRGDWIDVTRGLSEGQRIVVAGAAAIRPGTVVKPVVLSEGLSR